jgi:hypothetical protein
MCLFVHLVSFFLSVSVIEWRIFCVSILVYLLSQAFAMGGGNLIARGVVYAGKTLKPPETEKTGSIAMRTDCQYRLWGAITSFQDDPPSLDTAITGPSALWRLHDSLP